MGSGASKKCWIFAETSIQCVQIMGIISGVQNAIPVLHLLLGLQSYLLSNLIIGLFRPIKMGDAKCPIRRLMGIARYVAAKGALISLRKMPWVKAHYQYPDTGWPAHYEWPRVLNDDTILDRNTDHAKEQRRKAGQLREEILGYQNECGKRKDIEGARYFRDVASELMKEYRGWEGAIKLMDDNDWKHGHISEQIAPYVDRALYSMDYPSER